MSAKRFAVLVSGTGRSLENLAEAIARDELPGEIGLVLSDREGVAALPRAARLQIDHLVVPFSRSLGVEAFSDRIFAEVEKRGCELVVLAGFLRLLRIPEPWLGRVINIHPALLPAFGGKGYYGHHVHEAVIASGVCFTGCTVHFVDNEFDHGQIFLQRCIEVHPDDTPDRLADRVFAEEMIALPEAVRGVLEGKYSLR
jgi:phosphoribosylglycinamide formyltransferase 1